MIYEICLNNSSAMGIQASVVIATYQRPELLSRCLHALIHQSVSCDKYEIIFLATGMTQELFVQ
jgi:glycosyltransferase involved in cell wall biosynthesis